MTRPTDLDQQLDDAFAPDDPMLHAWLDGGPDAADYEVATDPPEWEIDGQRTAEWALRRLKRSTGEREAAATLAAELRAQANEYEAKVARRTERDIEFFEGRLRAFHDQLLAENPKRKTVELPSATLKRTAGGVSAVIDDEAKLIAWLEEHDDELLNYTDPTVKKTPLKAKYGAKVAEEVGAYPALDAATGEVLPGVKIVRGEATEKVVWTESTPVEVEPEDEDGDRAMTTAEDAFDGWEQG